MIERDWQARVVDNFDMMTKDLYIFQKRENATLFLTPKGVKSVLVNKQIESMHFARFENDQARAIADAFDKADMKTESTYKIEGLLEATKAHLEDMRSLVFTKGTDLVATDKDVK